MCPPHTPFFTGLGGGAPYLIFALGNYGILWRFQCGQRLFTLFNILKILLSKLPKSLIFQPYNIHVLILYPGPILLTINDSFPFLNLDKPAVLRFYKTEPKKLQILRRHCCLLKSRSTIMFQSLMTFFSKSTGCSSFLDFARTLGLQDNTVQQPAGPQSKRKIRSKIFKLWVWKMTEHNPAAADASS